MNSQYDSKNDSEVVFLFLNERLEDYMALSLAALILIFVLLFY